MMTSEALALRAAEALRVIDTVPGARENTPKTLLNVVHAILRGDYDDNLAAGKTWTGKPRRSQ